MIEALRSEIVGRIDALEDLVPAWWDLWRRSRGATPFQSPAWLLPWWRAFQPGQLASVVVWQGDRLVALAPLYLERGPERRLLPVGIGVSDQLDLLLDPLTCDQAAQRLADAVAAIGSWRFWELQELAPGAAAHALPRPPCCLEQTARQSSCPVLPLWHATDALAVVPAGQRRKIRMARRRSGRRGAQVRQLEAEEVDRFLSELCRLHAARWTARGEAGVLADPRVQAFHRQALPLLARARLLRAVLLSIDGTVAAAYYGLQHGRHAYAYLGGFHPDFEYESPGSVLLAHAIEVAHREGARDFNLLRGREAYKFAWGAEDRWNSRRSFRRDGVRHAAAAT